MKLAFVYMPVKDVKAALTLYRDHLGLQETWREGEGTVGLELPGTDVILMLDQDVGDEPQVAGPFFLVDSIDDFYAKNRDALAFAVEPKDIPPGRYAAFTDPSGNLVRVLTPPLTTRRFARRESSSRTARSLRVANVTPWPRSRVRGTSVWESLSASLSGPASAPRWTTWASAWVSV